MSYNGLEAIFEEFLFNSILLNLKVDHFSKSFIFEKKHDNLNWAFSPMLDILYKTHIQQSALYMQPVARKQ